MAEYSSDSDFQSSRRKRSDGYRLDIASLGASHRAGDLAASKPIHVAGHQRGAGHWPVSCPRMIRALGTIGLDLVRYVQSIPLEPQLFTALLERWCPMTNSFHLPVGEMTITLEDVAMILGVVVDGPALIGPPVVGEGRRWANWDACCDELLGTHVWVDHDYVDPFDHDITARFQLKAGSMIPLRWLRWNFVMEDYSWETGPTFRHAVRAYILHLIGTLLIPDTSGSHVSLQYLPLLEDLEVFATYSIGSSILGHLYREFYLASKPSRTYLGGCLHLVQIWAWERLYVGRPTYFPPPDYPEGAPVAARYVL